MEKYMGYRAKALQQSDTAELAKINIDGTLFYIDLEKHEFRQVDNPHNRMTLGDIPEEMGFTHFLYDSETKNRYLGNYKEGDNLPDHVRIVLVPPLKDIDPVGLARRQGLPVFQEDTHRKMAQSLTTLGKKSNGAKRKIK
jgi:hypothetical protein